MQAFLNRAYILRDEASRNKSAHIRQVSLHVPHHAVAWSGGRKGQQPPPSIVALDLKHAKINFSKISAVGSQNIRGPWGPF